MRAYFRDFYFWLILIELGVLVILICYILVHWGSRQFIVDDIDSLPIAQAVLIPGSAPLRDGSLSSVVKDRADTAIAIYLSGKAQAILVSGDNGSLEHNEVNPIKKYLLKAGIPEEKIFLDHAGFDTYSSMYRARDIFLAKRIIIVTQSFHLPRAVFIARELGIEAYGVSADRGRYLLSNYIREVFADVKAVLDIGVNRAPKYLGDVIPLNRMSPN